MTTDIYGIRMYDLLNQYRTIGKRALKVDEFKILTRQTHPGDVG
jgi:plasmid replication initiation protein